MNSEEDEKKENEVRAKMARNFRLRELVHLKRVPKKHYLMTTRFNDKSHAEMLSYCNKIKGLKCIYGVPKEISGYVVKDAIMFILEMNNECDRIEGIGMVKNTVFPSRYGVYEDGNYNRFSYLGKARIDRNDMTEEEDAVLVALDIICFKGKCHLKRSHGITIFPPDVLEKCKKKMDITEYIVNMFKNRL
jgi:hypothetical protein